MCISLSAQGTPASKPATCSLSPVCSLCFKFLTQTRYPTLCYWLGEWHYTNREKGAEARGGAQTGRRTLPLPDNLEVTGSKAMGKTGVLGSEWGGGSGVLGIFHKKIWNCIGVYMGYHF